MHVHSMEALYPTSMLGLVNRMYFSIIGVDIVCSGGRKTTA